MYRSLLMAKYFPKFISYKLLTMDYIKTLIATIDNAIVFLFFYYSAHAYLGGSMGLNL